VSYTYLVIIGIVLLALLGFQRGWLREIATLGGLLLSWLMVLALGGALVSIANRVVLIVRFTVLGGFDSSNPDFLLESLRRAPPLDPRRPDVVLGILFVLFAAGAFFAAIRFAPPATAFSARALGLLIGIANGYLVCYLVLRFLVPAARVSFAVPLLPSDTEIPLGRYLPTVLLVGVLGAIGVALLSSKRLGGRSTGRVAAGRAKG
jgi:hypothetical protein